jgi:hypothetical protein
MWSHSKGVGGSDTGNEVNRIPECFDAKTLHVFFEREEGSAVLVIIILEIFEVDAIFPEIQYYSTILGFRYTFFTSLKNFTML